MLGESHQNGGNPLRIKKVNTYHVRSDLAEPFGFSQFYYTQRENLLIEIVSDSGETGWGECYGPARPIQETIHNHIEPMVRGRNPFDSELIWHSLWQRYLDHARHGTFMAAISGIDIALWDLKGQLTGLPLYRLLGGTAVDQVPCYATGHYFRKAPEDAVLKTILAEASQHVAHGFSALKLKIGKNPGFDHKVIVDVRNQFPDVILMADANHAYNLNEAVKIGRTLDEYNYAFFEEPIAPHHYNEFAKLRAKLDLAIATGECEQTRYGFRSLVESGGVDILQPDLAFCGGISEGLKIRALADSFGISVTPHAWGTWIGFAAALHFHATAPSNPGRHENQLCFLECDNSENPVKDKAFLEKIEIRNGCAVLPQRPGLGVTVDKSVLKQFMV